MELWALWVAQLVESVIQVWDSKRVEERRGNGGENNDKFSFFLWYIENINVMYWLLRPPETTIIPFWI